LAVHILVLRVDYDLGFTHLGFIEAMINHPSTVIVTAQKDDVLKKKVVTPQTFDPGMCVR